MARQDLKLWCFVLGPILFNPLHKTSLIRLIGYCYHPMHSDKAEKYKLQMKMSCEIEATMIISKHFSFQNQLTSAVSPPNIAKQLLVVVLLKNII